MESTEVEQIIKEVEEIFERRGLGAEDRAKVVGMLAQQYVQEKEVHYDFQHLSTENHKIFITNLTPAPASSPQLEQEQVQKQDQSAAKRPDPFSDLNIGTKQKSEIKAEKEDRKGADEQRKRKKQKFKQMLLKLEQCLTIFVETIHRAFTHLAFVKVGKTAKFQVEALYLKSLKAYLQNYQMKQKKRMGSEQTIEANLQLLTILCEKIPQFQTKFIDPQQQVKLASVSRLFKAPIF